MIGFRSYGGFTLIEMLIAIGVVVVLGALLASALPKALEGAGNAKCVSNLKSVGAASHTYFNDNGGNLFPSFWWYNTETASPTLRGFVEYLGEHGPFQGEETFRDTMLTCPSYKRKYPSLYPSNWNRAYSLNYFAHMYEPGAQQSGNPAAAMYPGNINRIRSLSKMWMFMDGSFPTWGMDMRLMPQIFTQESKMLFSLTGMSRRWGRRFLGNRIQMTSGEDLMSSDVLTSEHCFEVENGPSKGVPNRERKVMKTVEEKVRPVTLITLARAVGLSRSTVSAALNGDERYSEETIKRVQDMAKSFNYQPNRSAQTVRRGRSNIIGVMHSGGTLQVVSERAHFLGQYIAKTGYELLLSDVLWHPKGTQTIVDHMLASRVEGVVFSAGGSLEREVIAQIFARFRRANIPVVCVSHESMEGISVVNSHFAEGFRSLTEHLIENGHRRLSLLLASRPNHTWHDPLRLAGFTQAIKAAGGRVAEARPVESYRSKWKGAGIQGEVLYYTGKMDTIFAPSRAPQKAMEILLDAGFNGDALLASNDEWASSAVSVCLRRGIGVPDQLAVTGFDDSDLATLCPVPLTTVSQRSDETCRMAVEILMKRLQGSNDPAQTIVMPCRLVVRSSSIRK